MKEIKRRLKGIKMFQFKLSFPNIKERLQIFIKGDLLIDKKSAESLYYLLQKALNKDMIPQFTILGELLMIPKEIVNIKRLRGKNV